MKKFDYEVPEIDIILLNADDVLSESGGLPIQEEDPYVAPWFE